MCVAMVRYNEDTPIRDLDLVLTDQHIHQSIKCQFVVDVQLDRPCHGHLATLDIVVYVVCPTTCAGVLTCPSN